MNKALAQTVLLGAGAVIGIAMLLGGTSATAQEGRRGGGAGPAAEPARGEGRGPAGRATFYSLNDPAPRDPVLKPVTAVPAPCSTTHVSIVRSWNSTDGSVMLRMFTLK